jgi:hemimethylated DNA binding protein
MTTYVAERHLDIDSSAEPITHPLTEDFFDSFENGVYQRFRTNN